MAAIAPTFSPVPGLDGAIEIIHGIVRRWRHRDHPWDCSTTVGAASPTGRDVGARGTGDAIPAARAVDVGAAADASLPAINDDVPNSHDTVLLSTRGYRRPTRTIPITMPILAYAYVLLQGIDPSSILHGILVGRGVAGTRSLECMTSRRRGGWGVGG